VNKVDADDFGEMDEEVDKERDVGESMSPALELFMNS
jgi:hypothetical protein